MEKSDKFRILSHLFSTHELLVILCKVLHFSDVVEVWKSLRKSGYCHTRTPCHSLLSSRRSSTLFRGVEVWKIRQSQDVVTHLPQSLTHCHSFLTSKPFRGVKVKSPIKSGYCHPSLLILYFSSTLLRGVEVWKSPTKCGYCHTFPIRI